MPNVHSSSPSILFLAGDVSGDVHAAALGRALLARDPDRSLHALGGRRLREVVEQSARGYFLADTTNASAIGFLSSYRIYFHCRGLRERLRKFIRTHRVDLAVLCDWGAFNSCVLPELHARGIPTLYYFPPRSWQRTGAPRREIVRYATRIATPFPWSADQLRKAGAVADWVGHPSLENIPGSDERSGLRLRFGIAPNDRLIALLPGSRPSEIRVLASRMAKAAALINEKMPAQFIAVVPRELLDETRPHLPTSIRIVTDCAKELLVASDAAIVKTGTGTLEAAIANTPQVAIYDVSWPRRIEWLLAWAWRWVAFIAMPNIVLEREVVPELMGLSCNPQKIADTLLRILGDDAIREKMLRDYDLIRKTLGSELPVTPTERTAQIVEEMLGDANRNAVLEPLAAEAH
jgi:lipid-A-disaccharide synthase